MYIFSFFDKSGHSHKFAAFFSYIYDFKQQGPQQQQNVF